MTQTIGWGMLITLGMYIWIVIYRKYSGRNS